MEKYIKQLNINNFRGIKGLVLDDLKFINVILGDNNSGKTNLLQSILFLKNQYKNNRGSFENDEVGAFFSSNTIDNIGNIVDLSSLNNSFELFNLIYQNKKYKDSCVDILKLFDPNIIDITILKDEFNNQIEGIKSSLMGEVKVSIYGNGIKKALNIMGGLIKAQNGILLIDEFESSLHVKYFQDIFSFLIKAREQFNVQLFLTTHSLELIDALLAIDVPNDSNLVSFITLRRDNLSNKTLARILNFKQVKKNRETFNFDVRF